MTTMPRLSKYYGYVVNNAFFIKPEQSTTDEDLEKLRVEVGRRLKVYRNISAPNEDEAFQILKEKYYNNEFN